MRKIIFTTVLAIVLMASGAPLYPQSSNYGEDLTHVVHYELGDTHFLNGDGITIDSMLGTANVVRVGNLYQIKGHYKLASHPQARIGAEITNASPGTRSMNLQYVTLDKGEGTFTLYLYLSGHGWPHLSFYPMDGGQSFSALYFGNGATLHR